ncbi:cell adhesion molecule 4-like isoform X2 [Anneissia japonica]|uniref:cell adhesion molecule 4-like isoform X2 n=1 Tax=Anneissia japonica TaxID=1529436 RepID=UPI001425BB51|nr:cell adhesion molecule 4-like isoform X2 [Anneissia japonica]XP_033118816.1 cell adhesion molecule 4-like isoform X2 [Anneissia japonica]
MSMIAKRQVEIILESLDLKFKFTKSLNMRLSLILLQICIAYAVRFDAKPNDVQEHEGQIAILKCYLGEFNKQNNVVSWWKEDEQISLNDMVKAADQRISVNLEKLPYTGAYSYSLQITDLKLKDKGSYHCQIDGFPKIISGTARLGVMQIPSSEYPKCSKSANSYIVGRDVKLSCISELISPPVNLRWSRKDTFILPTNIQSEILDDLVYNHYTFIAKKTDNDANFVCEQTTDAISEIINCTIQNLNIQYRPEVKIQHTSALVAGSDSILFCQSFANPPVMIFRWTSTPVLNDNEYIADGQVLTLIKPSIARNGTRITCSAENKVGISTDTTTLHIIKEQRRENNIHGNDNDIENSLETKENNMEITRKNNQGVSLYVVIIIIVLVVIIVVVVVIIPVYYHCFCKTRAATDLTGREIYQPTVYYNTRDRSSNSGLYDRSLPHLPNTRHYVHWRHSFASQVPEDLDQQGYMYIDEKNGQNTL